MAKKSRKRHHRKSSPNSKYTNIYLEYYQRAFYLFHDELEKQGYSIETPHPIRERYWGLLAYREYSPLESRPLVLQYLRIVENELAKIISKNSLAYWLHLYRRTTPSAISTDDRPITIGLTRAVFEASFQKYASFDICNRVGISGEIPISKVLNGLLMSSEFTEERNAVEEFKQLVLTDFGPNELRELYDAEKLAFEIWRCGAMLRIIGKGAKIGVGENLLRVFDLRTDELDELVNIYDERQRETTISASGVIFSQELPAPGSYFFPTYNLGRIKSDDLKAFFEEAFKINLIMPGQFNFIWSPYSIKNYRNSHLPFANSFEQLHHVDLDSILLIPNALLYRVFRLWLEHGMQSIIKYWQRAYEGPALKQLVSEEIEFFLPTVAEQIGITNIANINIEGAIKFWELTDRKRSGIDLVYPGPHYLFMPFEDDRFFIDFAWLHRRLYDLFVGVKISDNNFKGDALEQIVRYKPSKLPVKACKAMNGEKRQIDAAFEIDNALLVVECRAIGKSIGFDKGNSDAIRYRNQALDKMLTDIDEKAHWLAKNPRGTNYDITMYARIIPVAVTPFVEYIPTLSKRYWLRDRLPRILTPTELKSLIDDKALKDITDNIVNIVH